MVTCTMDVDTADKPTESYCKESPPTLPQPKNGFAPRKRKGIDEPSSAAKRFKEETEVSDEVHLVSFPDDVLIIILSYLDHASLLNLMEACTLFARLCQDYTLWRNVHYLAAPASVQNAESIAKLVHRETLSISILGDPNEDIISTEWMNSISKNCPNLETLALRKHHIDCRAINLSNFPTSLTSLDLSGSNLTKLPAARSYFREIYLLMPNLKSMILSQCHWLEPHSLMAISKCKHLEELVLYQCSQIKDCLAYCGLSCRSGFRALQTLDLRGCMVNSSELVCFSSVVTLKNLYLENMTQTPGLISSAIDILCSRSGLREVRIGMDGMRINPARAQLERLAVRNYKCINDDVLRRLAEHANTLTYLDVSGCDVTENGVTCFKSLRPNTKLVHHLPNE